jgi:hypothetical protein
MKLKPDSMNLDLSIGPILKQPIEAKPFVLLWYQALIIKVLRCVIVTAFSVDHRSDIIGNECMDESSVLYI